MLPRFAGVFPLVAVVANESICVLLLRITDIKDFNILIGHPIAIAGSGNVLFVSDILADNLHLAIGTLALFESPPLWQ